MKSTVKLVVALAATLFVTPAFAQDKITLSLATWGASSHPQVKTYAKVFMDEVTKRTNGKVEWKFFPDDTMVKQAFVPSAIPGGQVDISLTTLDNWVGRVPQVAITASPLWTLTMEQAQAELQPGKPLFKHFEDLLAKQNTKLLSLFDIGAPALFSKFDARDPASLKGRTLRAYSKGASQNLQALGAAPVTMGVADVYSALQRGAIDGALGGLQGAYGLKHYEVTKYALGTGGVLGALINGYVMNRRSFERLPDDVKQAVLEATQVALDTTNKEIAQSYQQYLADTRKHGLEVSELKPGTPERAAWEAALKEYREKIKGEFPAETVALVTSVR